MALGMLVEGEWIEHRKAHDASGRFVRNVTRFRDAISEAPGARFGPAEGRYHLYVSHACPWAHRTMIVRALRGLERAIPVSVVHPFMGDRGWTFAEGAGVVPDPRGAALLSEIYLRADPRFTGPVTVPVLWDTHERTIVNNESREIIRMFDTAFDDLATGPSLAPPALHAEIDAVMDAIYEPINNGVYRAGFARSQAAHEEAVGQLFAALDHWEAVLGNRRYLCGDVLTEADVALFTTLVRFDAVYHTHFKCNVRRIVDYPNLWSFVRALYQTPGVRETVHLDHIKAHYYQSHESINPRRLVPVGPALDLEAPHDRGSVG